MSFKIFESKQLWISLLMASSVNIMASLSSTRWGGTTVFTVTRVTHMVQNQDWTTDIQTVARLK